MKKILALVLALCLLSVCALAADSKTAGRGTVITGGTGDEATTEEVETIVTLADAPEAVLAEFEAAEAPIKAFTEETEAAVEALIGGEAEALDLIELQAITIAADAEGDIPVVMSFDEDFTQFQNIIAIISAGETELPYELEVNKDGDLEFTIPAADAETIKAATEPFIAILAK